MIAKEDITIKMQETVQMCDRTKELVSMVHEARNRYNLVAQEVKQQYEDLVTTSNSVRRRSIHGTTR